MKEIEEILRENKPSVPDGEDFMIELNARLEAVEKIKAAICAERRRGRVRLLAALLAGLAAGGLLMALVLLSPALPEAPGWLVKGSFWSDLLSRVIVFLKGWQMYLLPAIALVATALGLAPLLSRPRE